MKKSNLCDTKTKLSHKNYGVVMNISREKLIETMERYFGFHTFRAGQESIVNAILENNDVFAVMPTGGGKSLCYQLPACVLDGTCMVISPLIALMKDQVDAATESGIRAAFLNSSQSESERQNVLRKLFKKELDLIYVSPERFSQEQFRSSLKQFPLCFVAIDEAHCICEWGHDFRPDYLNLSEIVRELPQIPVAAFTATVTDTMQNDIVKRLGLRKPYLYKGSFDRKNLFYEVVNKNDPDTQILEYVRKFAGDSGIVYRTTRASVDETAGFLCLNGIKALPYHAGLDDSVRERNQEAFSRDQVDIIVATIAFGMGIDKSNVRYVIHGDLPKSMENYYQESGRAGRDGEVAKCILLYSRGDIPKITYFIDKIEDELIRKLSYRSLEKMATYASVLSCRRKSILGHFGEIYPDDNCGNCDVCQSTQETVDITREAQMVLSAIIRTNERFGAGYIVDIVTGADTKQIRNLGHNSLKTWGVGKDKTKKEWFDIVDILKVKGVINQTDGAYPVLTLTEDSKEILFKGKKVSVLKRSEEQKKKPFAEKTDLYDIELFERLRTLRREIAAKQNVPPFVVFADSTLHEMARKFPMKNHEMLSITGVGNVKLERYGEQFIGVIKIYDTEMPDAKLKFANVGKEKPAVIRVSSKANGLSATFTETRDLLKRGLTIQEVANEKKVTAGTIISHIEKLLQHGEIDSIDSYISKVRFETIENLFKKVESTALGPIVEASNGTVSYEEARLVRAWLQRA
jgi:ATP-dependent DNA helicase RecQ